MKCPNFFAKSECLIKTIEEKLGFIVKPVKSVRHRKVNCIDTRKLHHDTLSKT